jgi:Lipopolysaccharide kinase (Kdo/WaaP) family
VSTSFPNSLRRVRQAAAWSGLAPALPEPERLCARAIGEAVVEHRTSWVRRLPTAAGNIYLKTYEYPTWGDRLRTFGARTGPLARGRARREFDALAWQRQHGLAAPPPLAVFEWRCLGWLRRSLLITAAWPAPTAAAVLPTLPRVQQLALAAAIGVHLRTLHRLGFRDRNYDLRNLLVRPDGATWSIAKIDSPRFRLRRAGDRSDALSRADWARLLPQLAAFDLGSAALAGDASAPQP